MDVQDLLNPDGDIDILNPSPCPTSAPENLLKVTHDEIQLGLLHSVTDANRLRGRPGFCIITYI
jgi:hypothetical protein